MSNWLDINVLIGWVVFVFFSFVIKCIVHNIVNCWIAYCIIVEVYSVQVKEFDSIVQLYIIVYFKVAMFNVKCRNARFFLTHVINILKCPDSLKNFKSKWLQDIAIYTTARPDLQLSKQGPLLSVVLHLVRRLQQVALQVFPIQHILSMACHDPVKKFVKLFYAHFWKRTLCLQDMTFVKLSKCLAIIWRHQKKSWMQTWLQKYDFCLASAEPSNILQFFENVTTFDILTCLFPAKHYVFTSYTTAPIKRN